MILHLSFIFIFYNIDLNCLPISLPWLVHSSLLYFILALCVVVNQDKSQWMTMPGICEKILNFSVHFLKIQGAIATLTEQTYSQSEQGNVVWRVTEKCKQTWGSSIRENIVDWCRGRTHRWERINMSLLIGLVYRLISTVFSHETWKTWMWKSLVTLLTLP